MLRKDNLGRTQEVKQTCVQSSPQCLEMIPHTEKLLNVCEFMFAEVPAEQHAVCCCYDLMFVTLKRDIGATEVGVNKLDVVVVNQSGGQRQIMSVCSLRILVWKLKEIEAYAARTQFKMCCCLQNVLYLLLNI